MTTKEHAYSTNNPDVVAAFTAAAEARTAFARRVVADAKALGSNKGPLHNTHVFGGDETVGLAVDDADNPPDGWTPSKGRGYLVPRRGAPGADARRWLADHQPPAGSDVRAVMADHGLPRTTGLDFDHTNTISTPLLFCHDGEVWALYKRQPDDECTWTPRRLSEFHAAREAFDAHKAAVAVTA
jgi:hypothetical protein